MLSFSNALHVLTVAYLLSTQHTVSAGVTVYQTSLDPTSTYTAGQPTWTGAGSEDPTILTPPSPPAANSGQNTVFDVQLFDGGMDGLSQPTKGDFLGFSIELSVFSQLFGKNQTSLNPEFLNHLAALQQRGGGVTIRVGGNTQDRATMQDSLPDGGIIQKFKDATLGPTATPEVHFTTELLRMMSVVADTLNVKFFFGIPFLKVNSDGNAGLIKSTAEANEPDLYGAHLKMKPDYSQDDFFNDMDKMIASLPVNTPNIMGPSVCCNWNTQEVLDNGYISRFINQLKYIDAMRYPNNNCAGTIVPQDIFANYLTHKAAATFVEPYVPIAAQANSLGKPFVLLESNTASCGGFPGISDAFAASIWGIDMGLKMVASNFTYAMWHVGGRNVYYNPFTPPAGGKINRGKRWTTGSIYYSNLFVAEALGKSGDAQVVDLNLNGGYEFSPGYAIYEKGKASRVALINFVSDPSGANDYTANIQVGGGETGLPGVSPSEVYVKYLSAPSVSEKFNITWANQTFGGRFASDGRLYGDLDVKTVPCTNNVCSVQMKAPSAALVFLSQEALTLSNPPPDQNLTFTASADPYMVSIDWASVKASNGRNGQVPLGSTSTGSVSGALPRVSSQTVAYTSSLLFVFFSALFIVIY
ncbi:hypothetical protein FRC03_003721 [Tulasnella sp. 419]|nr:hypothetical protein FRC03_003721 [Tulasnella sp. 419]